MGLLLDSNFMAMVGIVSNEDSQAWINDSIVTQSERRSYFDQLVVFSRSLEWEQKHLPIDTDCAVRRNASWQVVGSRSIRGFGSCFKTCSLHVLGWVSCGGHSWTMENGELQKLKDKRKPSLSSYGYNIAQYDILAPV
jgi:hypothetical protein